MKENKEFGAYIELKFKYLKILKTLTKRKKKKKNEKQYFVVNYKDLNTVFYRFSLFDL